MLAWRWNSTEARAVVEWTRDKWAGWEVGETAKGWSATSELLLPTENLCCLFTACFPHPGLCTLEGRHLAPGLGWKESAALMIIVCIFFSLYFFFSFDFLIDI